MRLVSIRPVVLALIGMPLASAPLPAVAEQGDGSVVARASVTTAIVEREPVDSVETLGTDYDRVFYFTEIRDQSGRMLVHRWSFGGETMAEVSFAIGGPRWRVYSSKRLRPEWIGEWRIAVVDEDGAVLHEDRFTYGAPAPAPPATAGEATLPAAAESPAAPDAP